MDKYYHVYIHLVGWSCSRNMYHHGVVHLSDDSENTLCGVRISGQDWWKDSSFHAFQFADMVYEHRPSISPGDEIFCKRCGRIYSKEIPDATPTIIPCQKSKSKTPTESKLKPEFAKKYLTKKPYNHRAF